MSSNRDFDREVTFEIVEEIGVIATHSTGWKKELNLVSWNGGQAKYDIRDWDPGHSRMSRGVTLKRAGDASDRRAASKTHGHTAETGNRSRASWWIRQWIRQRALQKLRLHRYQMGRARQCRRQTCRVRKHSSLGRSLCRDLCGKRRSRRNAGIPTDAGLARDGSI